MPTLPDEHGVVLRTDMTSHVLQPGELSGSVHLAVQIDRLRARVAWDLAAGGARPERIDAGAPGGLGLISQRVLSIPTGEGDRLRCQAIVLSAVVDGPSVVHLVADGTEHAGDGHTITRRYEITLPSAGSYMAMVTIHPDPAFVRRVRVELPGEPRRIDLTDLLVLTYA